MRRKARQRRRTGAARMARGLVPTALILLLAAACGSSGQAGGPAGRPAASAEPRASAVPAESRAEAAPGSPEPHSSAGSVAPKAPPGQGAPGGASSRETPSPPDRPQAAGGKPSPEAREAATPGTSPASSPAPLSIRFVVRKQESREEIPAGYFEVRLVSLEPVKQAEEPSGAAGVPAGAAKTGTGKPDGSPSPASPAKAPAIAPASPQLMLVTQPDGSKETFVVGVTPGSYALRVTARGRKMLLRTLEIRPTDRIFDIALDPEPPAGASPSPGQP